MFPTVSQSHPLHILIYIPSPLHSLTLCRYYSRLPLSRASWEPKFVSFHAKAQTRDLQDHSPTLWRLHLLNPNSMLSDNGCTYISWIFSDIDIAPSTNHNKPYYILISLHQKLSNYMLPKVVYDGICAETILTMMRFDRKRNGPAGGYCAFLCSDWD